MRSTYDDLYAVLDGLQIHETTCFANDFERNYKLDDILADYHGSVVFIHNVRECAKRLEKDYPEFTKVVVFSAILYAWQNSAEGAMSLAFERLSLLDSKKTNTGGRYIGRMLSSIKCGIETMCDIFTQKLDVNIKAEWENGKLSLREIDSDFDEDEVIA